MYLEQIHSPSDIKGYTPARRRALAAEKLDAKIVLQIHDELLVEAAEAEAPRVLELLKETMRHAAELRVLLEVDAHIGASWLEAH